LFELISERANQAARRRERAVRRRAGGLSKSICSPTAGPVPERRRGGLTSATSFLVIAAWRKIYLRRLALFVLFIQIIGIRAGEIALVLAPGRKP